MVMGSEVRTTEQSPALTMASAPPYQHSECSQPAVAWSLGVVWFSAQGLDTSAAPPFAMAGLWCHCPTHSPEVPASALPVFSLCSLGNTASRGQSQLRQDQ